MHPIEFTWYKAIVLITSAMAIGFGILNIYYFNRIRVNNNCQDLSSGSADVAMWLNILLVIFGGILFFWSLFRLIFSGGMTKDVVNKTYNTHYYAPGDHSAEPIPIASPQSNCYSPSLHPSLSFSQLPQTPLAVTSTTFTEV